MADTGKGRRFVDLWRFTFGRQVLPRKGSWTIAANGECPYRPRRFQLSNGINGRPRVSHGRGLWSIPASPDAASAGLTDLQTVFMITCPASTSRGENRAQRLPGAVRAAAHRVSGANPHDLRDVSSITTELSPVRMVARLTMMVARRHLSASLTIQLADPFVNRAHPLLLIVTLLRTRCGLALAIVRRFCLYGRRAAAIPLIALRHTGRLSSFPARGIGVGALGQLSRRNWWEPLRAWLAYFWHRLSATVLSLSPGRLSCLFAAVEW